MKSLHARIERLAQRLHQQAGTDYTLIRLRGELLGFDPAELDADANLRAQLGGRWVLSDFYEALDQLRTAAAEGTPI